jgi:NAD(P)-dependent dehydrogenase (short-subunit alcohol dehydrogenase family)
MSQFPEGVAVVIGGSGGLGRAICLGLAAQGSNVLLSYRSNAAAANTLVSRLTDSGVKAAALQLELSNCEQVATAFRDVHARHGRIHTVVFAAGADISMTYVANIDPEEWRRTMAGDLDGFFHVARAALPVMREGGGGSIVAITSAGIDRHPPMDILSVVPKAGIEALVRGIAREEGRYNIRANCVAPGVVDGGLFLRLQNQVKPEFVEAMRRNTALRRFATLEEVANVAVFLASNAACYVTGQHLAVDGGYSV